MKPASLPILSVVFSIVFWSMDSIIDVLVFGENESILKNFIAPEPLELWMRILVVTLLVIFSFYAKYLLTLQIKASIELEKYKDDLEVIVELRTKELLSKNKELQNEIVIRKNTEQALEEIAITDPLTFLYNRRKFNEMLKHEIVRERRYKSGLLLIMCDIDNFKKINDTYGHNAGDEVLKTVATIMRSAIRKSDLIARWGGEEFILLISNTDIDWAVVIAEKLRKLIEDADFKVVDKVTASFGLAFFEGDDTGESLVSHADKALYKAKQGGRNAVEIYNAAMSE